MEINWEDELRMRYDEDHWFPFVEDENCNITGYGHQDEGEFAAAVNRYDEYATGEAFPQDEQWTADDINHQWATPTFDKQGEWLLHPYAAGNAPGAIPITTLWGAR